MIKKYQDSCFVGFGGQWSLGLSPHVVSRGIHVACKNMLRVMMNAMECLVCVIHMEMLSKNTWRLSFVGDLWSSVV